MKATLASFFTITLTFFLSSFGEAQTLSLFEELDDNGSDTPRGRRGRAPDGSPTSGLPEELILLGTTRIGDHFSVMLRDSRGNSINVRKPLASDVVLPDYPGYIIENAESGRVSVRYPESIFCVESEENGVRCLDSNTAVLSLTNREPLINSSFSDVNSFEDALLSSTNQTQEEESVVNPFEAMRRRSIDPDTDTQENTEFRPRRINPEDIPPGMRVVSTPFGDRLVEIDQ
ncbi:hypothetical protein OAL54_08700 [Gammaproteobacteria bacterium]|nr:hypothetical protein [Gammaproteobacteria bacterium]